MLEHIWNPFLTFCVLVILGGLIFQLTEIWMAYANRPPRCKCKCRREE